MSTGSAAAPPPVADSRGAAAVCLRPPRGGLARRSLPGLLAAAILGLAAACGGDEEIGCVEVNPGCTPLYTPTFEQIFARTLQPTCGVAGSSCHSAQGARAGLVFAEADAAHDLLLGRSDGRVRVVPGDTSCSILVARIASPSRALVMPPGGALGAGEQCAIIQWVASGAAR